MPTKYLKRALVISLLVLVLLGALVASRLGFLKTAAEAYLYGYPLVAMAVTRERSEQFIAPKNTLFRNRRMIDADFKEVVRPSVDLMYAMAFIDLNDGPMVYTMPAGAQRYTLVPLLDAWSNVFASVGTRTTGNSESRYLLAGPQWQGTVPSGLNLVRSPTRMVWMVARTQLNGEADLPTVYKVQDGIRLESLAQWQAHPGGPHEPAEDLPDPAKKPGFKESPAPAQVMQDMPAGEFFERLMRLMVDNPATPRDGPRLARMASIGLVPGKALEWGLVDHVFARLGRHLADRGIAQAQSQAQHDTVDGWWTPPDNLGNFGEDYHLRAAVAMVALAANQPVDAMYPNAAIDAAGHTLHGDGTYRLHFKKGQLPPVRAFWSVTAYGPDAFLIANPDHRYSIRSSDPLKFNPDGSLDLYVSAKQPDGVSAPNWLPVRGGEPFQITARLYWPEQAALDRRWHMPGLERIR